MFKKTLYFFLFSLFYVHTTFASGRGIILAVCDRYSETVIPSLYILREAYKCTLPIEIWYSGDEISSNLKKRLGGLQGVTFHDISKVMGGDAEQYRGFQIKAYILHATQFDEVILMDADLFFFKDPAVMFEHPDYLETGAYLFRDQEWFKFGVRYGKNHHYPDGMQTYKERKKYITSHIQSPSDYIPLEWQHYWDPNFFANKKNRVPSEHLESGCVVIDKRRHQRGIQNIVAFNDDREVFYKLFLGDKESFWLGLEKAKEAYSINPEVCYTFLANRADQSVGRVVSGYIDIVHKVDGELFFLQKAPRFSLVSPVLVDNRCQFIPRLGSDWREHKKELTQEEVSQFQQLAFLFHLYGTG